MCLQCESHQHANDVVYVRSPVSEVNLALTSSAAVNAYHFAYDAAKADAALASFLLVCPRIPLRSATTPAKRASRKPTVTLSATVRRTPKILLSASDPPPAAKTWTTSDLPPAAKIWKTKHNVERVGETASKQRNYFCVVREKALRRTLKVLRLLVAGKLFIGDS